MINKGQAGYFGNLSLFEKEKSSEIIDKLHDYVEDADESQIRAWKESVSILKTTVNNLKDSFPDLFSEATIILEYTIPLEERRIDSVILMGGTVFVIEFKGKSMALQADIDQASAYARDLMAYHKATQDTPVKCILLLTQYQGLPQNNQMVDILGPENLLDYLTIETNSEKSPGLEEFLSFEAFQPLPSLIKAARELFESGRLTRIHRAAIATEPTLSECSKIVKVTAIQQRRSLILISGVPGAGKTLVGLQLAHANYLDDLAIERANGEKPTAPAVYLSGNGPLVEVLQYEFRSAGGDGKAFVRGVHEYVKTFTRSKNLIPPHHVLIYDEAQRAFDAAQVEAKHRDLTKEFYGLSEPELFIQFAERVPEWSVVVGLIGTGQEIHIGEEGGIRQWKKAISNSKKPHMWDIYIPKTEEISKSFEGAQNLKESEVLELSTTIRFHMATQLYEFVENLLNGIDERAKQLSIELETNGFHLRITRNLEVAKQYLHNRYSDDQDARYGLIASAKDKALINFGIPKGFRNPGEVRPGQYGKWYVEEKGKAESCTRLERVATEFGTQGLELDSCLLAWGTDFIRENGGWTNKYAAGYREAHRIKDAKTLRKNAYRVLLTRGRDGCVVFVPQISELFETYQFLLKCGFLELR